MPEWIIAMFLIGVLLSAGDMAKIFLEARRSRREAASMTSSAETADGALRRFVPRSGRELLPDAVKKCDAGDGPGGQDSGKRTAGSL